MLALLGCGSRRQKAKASAFDSDAPARSRACPFLEIKGHESDRTRSIGSSSLLNAILDVTSSQDHGDESQTEKPASPRRPPPIDWIVKPRPTLPKPDHRQRQEPYQQATKTTRRLEPFVPRRPEPAAAAKERPTPPRRPPGPIYTRTPYSDFADDLYAVFRNPSLEDVSDPEDPFKASSPSLPPPPPPPTPLTLNKPLPPKPRPVTPMWTTARPSQVIETLQMKPPATPKRHVRNRTRSDITIPPTFDLSSHPFSASSLNNDRSSFSLSSISTPSINSRPPTPAQAHIARRMRGDSFHFPPRGPPPEVPLPPLPRTPPVAARRHARHKSEGSVGVRSMKAVR